VTQPSYSKPRRRASDTLDLTISERQEAITDAIGEMLSSQEAYEAIAEATRAIIERYIPTTKQISAAIEVGVANGLREALRGK
jgi:endonuclease III